MNELQAGRRPPGSSHPRDAHPWRAGLASESRRRADSVREQGNAMAVNPPDPPSVIDAAAPGAPAKTRPHVLLVHYTYTQQALRMSDAMADSMRERGCEV